jgi:hypothetical protein
LQPGRAIGAVNRLIIELAEELDPDGGEATFARQRQPSVMFGSGSKLSSLQSFLQRPEIRVERCVEGHEDVYFGRTEMRRFALTVEDARSFESPHGANPQRFIAAISRSRQVGSRRLVCKFTDRPPPLQLKYLQICHIVSSVRTPDQGQPTQTSERCHSEAALARETRWLQDSPRRLRSFYRFPAAWRNIERDNDAPRHAGGAKAAAVHRGSARSEEAGRELVLRVG